MAKISKLLPGTQKNIFLKNYTTFKIGGPAKYFFIAKTKDDLIKAIKMAKKMNPVRDYRDNKKTQRKQISNGVKLPFFVFGGGSNLLVSDNGFDGLVIKIENCKLKIENSKVITEAGVSLNKLVSVSVKKLLTGLEWAAGIPGTIGGAIHGNAGAFGTSMADIIESVEVLEIVNDKIREFKNSDCKFGYRDSIFKKKKNLIILSATLQLKKGKKKEIEKKIQENLKSRKEKQALNFSSAGSVFKNPVGFSAGELGEESKLSSSATERAKLSEGGKERIFFDFAAARLIEKCGLKGKRMGNAKISEKHANFIVNLGNARAEDVKKLINLIKKQVKKKFGVVLEEEIQYLGFEN